MTKKELYQKYLANIKDIKIGIQCCEYNLVQDGNDNLHGGYGDNEEELKELFGPSYLIAIDCFVSDFFKAYRRFSDDCDTIAGGLDILLKFLESKHLGTKPLVKMEWKKEEVKNEKMDEHD